MRFDHYILSLCPQEDFYLDRIQGLVWQSLINAVCSEMTQVLVKPYVLCAKRSEVFVSDSHFQVFEYKTSNSKLAPALQEVLNLAKVTGDSEFVIISNPDVVIKQTFYSIVEYYLASGHDALAISTHNTASCDISRIRRDNLIHYTWNFTGFTQNVDCFVFPRRFLDSFEVADAIAGLPYSAEIIWANLLKFSSRFKFLYEQPVTCRFNNLLFWDKNRRYDREILHNNKLACNLVEKLCSSENHKNSENYRRLNLRLKNIKSEHLTFDMRSEKQAIQFQEKPLALPGTIWAIATYFNPTGNKKILENYKKFSLNLRKQNVPLLTVELSFVSGEFALVKQDADILVQVDDGDVLWQKERMFNLALKYLPDSCDKVVYMDADIVFSDSAWLSNTAKELERYCFVQPFSKVIRLPKDGEFLEEGSYEVGWEDGQVIHSFAWGLKRFGKKALKTYPYHGTVGIALAARRCVMEKHGWFDADIVGSGDLLTVDSIMLDNNSRAEIMNDKFREFFIKWQTNFRKDVKNSFSYVPGIVYHFWHGNSKNRFYQERHRILEQFNYDPNSDIDMSNKGVWKWNSSKLELQCAVKGYFLHRDDG